MFGCRMLGNLNKEFEVKITREDKKFRPVVVILETEEEAAALWHVLNCSIDVTMREYIEGSYSFNSLLLEKIWSELDSVFVPVEVE